MIPALTCAPFLPGLEPGRPCTGDPDERRIHRHDPEPEAVGNPSGVRPRGRSRLRARLCARPRDGRLRPDPRAAPLDRPVGDADDRAAAATERIHFMLAHRPGFTAPTLAARQIATLDQFSRAGSPCTSSPAARTANSSATATLDHDAMRAPTNTSASSDESGPKRSRSITTVRTTGSNRGFGSEAVPAAACADLFRRRIGSGARSGRQARGRLRARGESLDQARPDHARARRSREAWPPGALLRVVPPDPRRDRRRSLGARASHLDETRRLREAAGLGAGGPQRSEGARRLLAAAERGSRVDKRRPRSRSSPAHARIRRRSSARPNRSPTRCSTTTTSASRRS